MFARSHNLQSFRKARYCDVTANGAFSEDQEHLVTSQINATVGLTSFMKAKKIFLKTKFS